MMVVLSGVQFLHRTEKNNPTYRNEEYEQTTVFSTFLSARSVKLALLGITFVALFYNKCAHAS